MRAKHGKTSEVRSSTRNIAPSHLVPRARRLASVVFVFQTQWGWMGISETSKGIDAVVMPQASRQALLSELPADSVELLEGRASSRLREAQAQLIDYLDGARQSFDLPLDLSGGTSFQQQVWRTLLSISYGRLRSYQWVAMRVGGSHYARAVGNAVGANPMPIIIPCHRIVAHDGSIGGFSCGLPLKRKLLTLECTIAQLRPER
jgi:methylated-DNA-[protein]-cysteine S-methyltransferase